MKFCHVRLFKLTKPRSRHLNTKCHTDSEDDCEPYNKQFIDLACSVCTVKYGLRSVLKNLSPIFHGTDLTLGQ